MNYNYYCAENAPVEIPVSTVGEYICSIALNLYDSSECQTVATQIKKGRQLKILNIPPKKTKKEQGIQVYLCEDHYIAWLPIDNIFYLKPAVEVYQELIVDRLYIETKIPEIINFTKDAMKVPNFYLWGGTVAPHYDCSGLIQDSFSTFGIWLPRDSYQQEQFTRKINRDELKAGDLIFFGTNKVNHVALYLEDGYYIHSSGQEMGNNGIGINQLSDSSDPVSANYYKILWGFGRIEKSL
jgi:hypothetical protein